MIGNQSEDSLNYNLIMDGFYYDAEIEHITEVIKNNLYFAVLECENNKIIRNTSDTFYFNIDDELIYINYYYDFGPLNISCLYKYCCKLNKLFQFSQGLKRIVHYTTSNPTKRVNAAFLMGCYAIIYLNMESKDIYRILLQAGGPFKLYLDASQGVSPYTIKLLDCFQAIQKALTCNFFNFEDFNVNDYDCLIKLQNGDMNWLVPRKFLAFIGPTDGDSINSHPPDFYMKYFVENDIKMVIRLNNKVYDASVFTQVGIDHHDLYFPDGTVPNKQILWKFLELTESTNSAIAVHCKAGLGRTGSLIGAYIIKHYHMTAKEAIAWMRICRPGSVIGQQQGWLEKLESWLWKQGSHYRLQHYGDSDKIPHDKYGIYSFQWIKERENLIQQTRKIKLEGHNKISKPKQLENAHGKIKSKQTRKESESNDRNNLKKINSSKKPTIKSISFNPKSAQLTERGENPKCKLNNKLNKNSFTPDSKTKPLHEQKENRIGTPQAQAVRNKLKEKIPNGSFKYAGELNFENQDQMYKADEQKQMKSINATKFYEVYEARNKIDFPDDIWGTKLQQKRFKRRTHSEFRENDNKMATRVRQTFINSLEPTQGDKLNQIKLNRYKVDTENDIKVKKNITRKSSNFKVEEFNTNKGNFKDQNRRIRPTSKNC